ncbi:MAG: radical SAM protein [Patescibacteria group bacterium]
MQNKIDKKNVFVANIPFSRHVLLEITKQCNLNCRHCFTSAGSTMDNELNPKQIRLMLTDLLNHGFNAFTVSGGEPLLKFKHVELVLKILRSTSKKMIKTYLFTNGLLLNERTFLNFRPFLNGICLSLDGTEKEHDWLRKKAWLLSSNVTSYQYVTKTQLSHFYPKHGNQPEYF